MCSLAAALAALPSRANRATTEVSRVNSRSRILMAKRSGPDRASASYTTPMPPWPRVPTMR